MTDLIDAPSPVRAGERPATSRPLPPARGSATGGASIARATVLLTGATLVASASNYLVNIVLARWMDPAQFGDANLIVTLMLIITAVAVTLQLTTARSISTSTDDRHAADRRRFVKRATRVGVAAAAGVIVVSPFIRDLTSSASALPFVVFAAGLPLYLAQAVERGLLQGRLRFGPLAATFVVEAATRTLVAIGLVAAGLGVVGATIGLTASFAASWVAARRATTSEIERTDRAAPVHAGEVQAATEPPEPKIGTSGRGIASATTILLVGQIVINNGDVVLAKALFEPTLAGQYAVVALVGRAVFFCSWSVVTAAFPHAARGDDRTARNAVRAVAMMCALLTGAVAVGAPHLAPRVFGDAHRAVTELFLPYAFATSLFAVANVIATLDVARGRTRTAWVVLGGAVLQTLLLLAAARDPGRMVSLQIVAMGVVVAAAGLTRSPTRADENVDGPEVRAEADRSDGRQHRD